MIKSVTVTNYIGESLEMVLANPYETGFAITSITGIGPIAATINTATAATYDGTLFNSARFNERNIVLSIVFVGDELIETIRHRTYRYFPVKKPLTLRFKTDNRDLEIAGYVESNEPNIFSERESCQISIICPDPLFYGVGEEATSVTNFTETVPEFKFKFATSDWSDNKIEFSKRERQTTRAVVWDSTIDTGVLIEVRFVKDAKGINIKDNTTGQTLTFSHDDTTFKAGDILTVSTIPGNKYARLRRGEDTINVLNYLTASSGWPLLSMGTNVFEYEIIGNTDPTASVENVKITARKRYEGV